MTQIVCAYCGGPYQPPTVILGCNHKACGVCTQRAFALECARTLGTTPASTSPTPAPDVSLRCPLCDIVTKLPREEGVAAITPSKPPAPESPPPPLPTQPPPPKPKCENCEQGKDATCRCTQGCGLLCDACWEEVHKSKVHRGHTRSPPTDSTAPSSPSLSEKEGGAAVVDWKCVLHPGKDLEAYDFTCKTLLCPVCALSRTHSGHEVVLVSEHVEAARRKLTDTARMLAAQAKQFEHAAAAAQEEAASISALQAQFEQRTAALVRAIEDAVHAKAGELVAAAKEKADAKVMCLVEQEEALSRVAEHAGQLSTIATASAERYTDSPAAVFLRSAAFWRLAHGYSPEAKLPLEPLAVKHAPPKLSDAVDPAAVEAILGLAPPTQPSPASAPSAAPVQTGGAQPAQRPPSPVSIMPQMRGHSLSAALPPSAIAAARSSAPVTPAAFAPPSFKPTSPTITHPRSISTPVLPGTKFITRPHIAIPAVGKDPSLEPAVAMPPVVEVRCGRVQRLRGEAETLAGSATEGFANAVKAAAQFNRPNSIAMDDTAGVLYVADSRNNCIRSVRVADGTVSTVAGSPVSGLVNSQGAGAKFNQPAGIARDPRTGVLYVADRENHVVRAIDATDGFRVTTVAGNGWPGLRDGDGQTAQFNRPWGIAIDGAGAIFVADHGNHTVRRVALPAGPGKPVIVSTVSALGKLNGPSAVRVDTEGSLYVVEAEGRSVRKLTRAGTEAATVPGCAASAGKFVYPCDIAIDEALFLYVADWGCDRIKRVDPRSGTVTIVAESAALSKPVALTLSLEGTLFVADWHSIHRIV